MTAGGGSSNSKTSKPSSLGICTSRKTKSGLSSPIAFTASKPLPHSATTSAPPASQAYSRRSWRASSSSSTITVRRFIGLLGDLTGHGDFGAEAVSVRARGEAAGRAEASLQPRADVAQAHAVTPRRRRFRVEAVLDGDAKLPVAHAAVHANGAAV